MADALNESDSLKTLQTNNHGVFKLLMDDTLNSADSLKPLQMNNHGVFKTGIGRCS